MNDEVVSQTGPQPSSVLEPAIALARRWWLIVGGALVCGLAALGVTYTMAPIYTARTSVLPPQPAQSAAANALASLGGLSGLAGAAPRSLGDQYAALLQSETIQDRIIDKFDLMASYRTKYRADARRVLEQRTRVAAGKKDGLLSLEVDDESPQRAAAIANRHIDELRLLTSQLTLTEAQQRRAFFEGHLKEARDRLAQSQSALQASGFNASTLRTDPRTAVENYARLRAEITGAEVRLQTLRRSLTDSAPEVQQQQSALAALREQLLRYEASGPAGGSTDYVSKYREFKYQETLFELFSRQYEMARVDESREGTLIQVVDIATPPELKSRPKRTMIAVMATLIAGLLLALLVLVIHALRQSADDPAQRERLHRLRAAFSGR